MIRNRQPHLAAKFITLMDFAFRNAFNSRFVDRIKFVFIFWLLLEKSPGKIKQFFQLRVESRFFTINITDDTTKISFQFFTFFPGPAKLLGSRIRTLFVQGLFGNPVITLAKIDIFRKHRTGIMEAILAEGKDADDVVEIARAQINATGRVLITRLGVRHREALEANFDAENIEWSLHDTAAVVHDGTPAPRTGGIVAIVTAGTADIDVAEDGIWFQHPAEEDRR